MIVINGDFYDHNITGVQRYAYEVIEKLDELITEGELSSSDFVLLVPKDLKKVPESPGRPLRKKQEAFLAAVGALPLLQKA